MCHLTEALFTLGDTLSKSATSAAFPTRWYQAWWAAITRPFPDAYHDLMRRVNKPLMIAYLWILIVGLMSGLSRLILFFYAYFDTSIPAVGVYLVAIPLLAVLTVVAWYTLMAGAVYLAARLLGGKGSLADTFYLKAAHVAPTLTLAIAISLLFWLIAVIFSVTISSTVVYWVVAPVIIYQVLLGFPTVKAAHDLDTTKSIIAGVVIPAVLLGVLYFASPYIPDMLPNG
jgi:hypothetical protein